MVTYKCVYEFLCRVLDEGVTFFCLCRCFIFVSAFKWLCLYLFVSTLLVCQMKLSYKKYMFVFCLCSCLIFVIVFKSLYLHLCVSTLKISGVWQMKVSHIDYLCVFCLCVCLIYGLIFNFFVSVFVCKYISGVCQMKLSN